MDNVAQSGLQSKKSAIRDTLAWRVTQDTGVQVPFARWESTLFGHWAHTTGYSSFSEIPQQWQKISDLLLFTAGFCYLLGASTCQRQSSYGLGKMGYYDSFKAQHCRRVISRFEFRLLNGLVSQLKKCFKANHSSKCIWNRLSDAQLVIFALCWNWLYRTYTWGFFNVVTWSF